MNQKQILKLTSTASVCTAFTLIALKTWAWLASDSISILASLIDSSMDSLASLVSFLSIRVALKPPDKAHRFGHGKAESLAALAQAAFIAGSAVFLLLQSVERIIEPKMMQHTELGLWVMAASVVLTLALVSLQRWAMRRVASQALAADSLHYVSDLLSNVTIIVALILTRFGFMQADAYFGLFLVLWILKNVWDIAKSALNDLMDRELPEEERKHIIDLISNTSGVLGYHDLKTRSSGGCYFIQFHVEVFSQLTFEQAHEITDKLEQKLKKHFENAEVIIHTDPIQLCLLKDRQTISE